MTACIVSLCRPVKTSVQHDEVSSLSINPVIELRQGRRDLHTKVVRGLSASIPPSLLPSFLFPCSLPGPTLCPPLYPHQTHTHFPFVHFLLKAPIFYLHISLNGSAHPQNTAHCWRKKKNKDNDMSGVGYATAHPAWASQSKTFNPASLDVSLCSFVAHKADKEMTY